jgi:hypothetical protein
MVTSPLISCPNQSLLTVLHLFFVELLGFLMLVLMYTSSGHLFNVYLLQLTTNNVSLCSLHDFEILLFLLISCYAFIHI